MPAGPFELLIAVPMLLLIAGIPIGSFVLALLLFMRVRRIEMMLKGPDEG